MSSGLGPWFGLRPAFTGRRPIPRAEPGLFLFGYGEAKPRLISGGEAVEDESTFMIDLDFQDGISYQAAEPRQRTFEARLSIDDRR